MCECEVQITAKMVYEILGFRKSLRGYEDFWDFLRDVQRFFEISKTFPETKTFQIFKILEALKDLRDLANF